MTSLARDLEPELLDQEGHDPDELAHSLAQVAQVNRWLGGSRSLRRHLGPLLDGAERIRVLDVGTGNGHTLLELGRWATARGARWMGVGIDRSRETAALAAREGVTVVRADGLRMPFADGAFDAVLCTLTLHHFGDDGARLLLAEMARVSRGLVLVSDLERSRLHWLGARLLAATLWRGNRLTRTDGPHSVLRSFTADELADLGRAAGLGQVRVERFLPWRLLLSGRATG